MQPVSSFINCTKPRHDTTYFESIIIGFDGQFVHRLRKFGQLQIGRHFVGNKQYSFFC